MTARQLPGLGLYGFWGAGATGWDVENDENLRKTSALVHGSIIDMVATEPVSPSEGDRYIITSGLNADKFALYDNAGWVYYDPIPGLLIWSVAEGVFKNWNGSAWVNFDPSDAGVILGAATLDQIGNVNAIEPADGQVLTWDEASLEWQPKPLVDIVIGDLDAALQDVQDARDEAVAAAANSPEGVLREYGLILDSGFANQGPKASGEGLLGFSTALPTGWSVVNHATESGLPLHPDLDNVIKTTSSTTALIQTYKFDAREGDVFYGDMLVCAMPNTSGIVRGLLTVRFYDYTGAQITAVNLVRHEFDGAGDGTWVRGTGSGDGVAVAPPGTVSASVETLRSGSGSGTLYMGAPRAHRFNVFEAQAYAKLSPKMFGCVGDGSTDDAAALTQAVVVSGAMGMPLHFRSDDTYLVSSALTISAGAKLTGSVNLKVEGSLVIGDNVTIDGTLCITRDASEVASWATMGANCSVDHIQTFSPGTVSGRGFIVGAGLTARSMKFVVDTNGDKLENETGAGGGTFLELDPSGCSIDYIRSYGHARPIAFQTGGGVIRGAGGGDIRRIDVRHYIRGVLFRRVDGFNVGRIDCRHRHPSASQGTAGQNAVLIIGCSDFNISETYSLNSSEHSIRFGGGEDMGRSNGWRIGSVTAVWDLPSAPTGGGSALKINANSQIVNWQIGSVRMIGAFNGAPGSNASAVRLSHCNQGRIGSIWASRGDINTGVSVDADIDAKTMIVFGPAIEDGSVTARFQITGGAQQTVNYSFSSGDSVNSIATGLAAALQANADISSAVATGDTIAISTTGGVAFLTVGASVASDASPNFSCGSLLTLNDTNRIHIDDISFDAPARRVIWIDDDLDTGDADDGGAGPGNVNRITIGSLRGNITGNYTDDSLIRISMPTAVIGDVSIGGLDVYLSGNLPLLSMSGTLNVAAGTQRMISGRKNGGTFASSINVPNNDTWACEIVSGVNRHHGRIAALSI